MTADSESAPGEKMRVVVVAHGPPLKGGIATVAADIVEDDGLNAQFDIVFQNTAQNDQKRGEMAVRNITRAFTDAVNTFRLAKRGGIVHSHAVQEPWLVGWRQVAIAVGARLKGARVLLHNHAPPPYMAEPGAYEVGRANAWAFAVLDRLVDANILIAEAGVPNLRKYMSTVPLPVVANSVIVGEVSPTTAAHEPPVILFVGELLERKGVVVLLDALDIIDSEGRHDYELVVVGDNRPGLEPGKDAMVAEITCRGRADSMTGPLQREGVYEWLSRCDVYVTPTQTEGQPFTVIEALAAGAPIVGSNIQALTNMISDGPNGRLRVWNDAEGFAEAISDLLANPDERKQISANNRQLAYERFDRSVFSANLAQLYRRYGTAYS